MKIKQIIIMSTLLIGVTSILNSRPSYSATCDGVNTSIISCDQTGDGYCANNPEGRKYVTYIDPKTKQLPLCDDGSQPDVLAATGVWGILLLILNILSAGVGILAVAGVIYGSILYTTAGGSVDQKKKGKVTILNVVIGLVAYALMYGFLNFIVPGGIFK